jgi:HAD superfamily hydrolase (TIGR01509 family)
MIKLIIFDLDGVLIDSKPLHFEALNLALPDKYKISIEEHLSTYDGLPTRKKLDLLKINKGLPSNLDDQIKKNKNEKTVELLKKNIVENHELIKILKKLKEQKFTIACASNAVRSTVKTSLLQLGVIEYFDFWYSNEDVVQPKPHFEMFFRCMLKANVGPSETLIIEDSHIGRQAVLNAGCHLLPVENVEDVTFQKIFSRLEDLKHTEKIRVPWRDQKLNVLIPMAGAGSRFQQAGYTFPKPLIEVGSKPMIQVVIENLNIKANYIFIVQKEHYEKYNLETVLNLIQPGCTIIQTEGVTQGAACTTLLAKDYINNDNPLIIANSDQYIEWDSNNTLYAFTTEGIDGGIITFKSTHPKWSYAKLDEKGFVYEVAEKQPISDNATVGVYYWKQGKSYVDSAEKMIDKNIRVNNEFYVCPVFNQLIQQGGKVRIKEIKKMWGLGTPEDLHHFLTHKQQ